MGKAAVTDADVMKGGLGGTDGAGDDDGKGKKGGASADDGKGGSGETVTVGGLEFPAELGGKLQTLVDGFSREMANLKGQVQTLSTVHQPAPKKGKDDDDDDLDVDTALFTDPKGTLNRVLSKFEKKIAKLIEESTGKAEAKQMAANQEREFWGLFYQDNPDLKDHDLIVKAIMNRDMAKLGTKTVDDAIKHISTETKKLILKMGGKEPVAGDKSRGVEGAGSRTNAGGKPAGDDEGDTPKVSSETLSGFLKVRRDARREASRVVSNKGS